MSSDADRAPSGEPGELTRRQRMLIQSRYDAFALLPAPQAGTWTSADVPAVIQHMLKTLSSNGIIPKTDTERTENSTRGVWRTDRRFWTALQSYEPGMPALPCSHHGIRNLRDGQYTCLAEWRDATFGRATVEEVLDDA